jgi:hypothetical protein
MLEIFFIVISTKSFYWVISYKIKAKWIWNENERKYDLLKVTQLKFKDKKSNFCWLIFVLTKKHENYFTIPCCNKYPLSSGVFHKKNLFAIFCKPTTSPFPSGFGGMKFEILDYIGIPDESLLQLTKSNADIMLPANSGIWKTNNTGNICHYLI